VSVTVAPPDFSTSHVIVIDRAPPARRAAYVVASRSEAIDYAGLIAGLGGCEPASGEEAARALFNHAVGLGVRGRPEDAVTAHSEVVARFADRPQLALLQLVAAALIFKGVTLGMLGRDQDAITAYDELIARFADSPEPTLRDKVDRARSYRRTRLGGVQAHNHNQPSRAR
jgi:hypothetical protein